MKGLEVRDACRPVALPLPLPSRFYKRDLEVGSWKCDILDQSTSTKLPIGSDWKLEVDYRGQMSGLSGETEPRRPDVGNKRSKDD